MTVAPNFSQAKKIIENEDYLIEDLELKEAGTGKTLCTVSRTTLKPARSTRGHYHKDIGETYMFESGDGMMALGSIENMYDVGPESIIFVDKGIKHRIWNRSRTIPLIFRTVFNGPSERPKFTNRAG